MNRNNLWLSGSWCRIKEEIHATVYVVLIAASSKRSESSSEPRYAVKNVCVGRSVLCTVIEFGSECRHYEMFSGLV